MYANSGDEVNRVRRCGLTVGMSVDTGNVVQQWGCGSTARTNGYRNWGWMGRHGSRPVASVGVCGWPLGAMLGNTGQPVTLVFSPCWSSLSRAASCPYGQAIPSMMPHRGEMWAGMGAKCCW